MSIVPLGGEIGRERTARHVPRHPHIAAYAALVLRGGYVEAGDRGRLRAVPGDVLIHDRFDAHQDHFGPEGADILNLPLAWLPAADFGRAADPDAIARLAERDPAAAAGLLVETLMDGRSAEADWPDRLAADLRSERVRRLDEWAEQAGLRPQSISRGFRLAYGVTPQRYRLELRAARAARALGRAGGALVEIALDSGFADQPHMNRAMRRLYATTPAAVRYGHVHPVQDEDGLRN